MFELDKIQALVRAGRLDGWLLYDFRGSNVLARRVLNMDDRSITSRRFYYFIPAQGAPQKLVHRIEQGVLDHLPGEKRVYLPWQELEAGIAQLVQGRAKVAMEYSPRNANPYVSRADAGTVELVRATGAEIVSSGNLVQAFEATWDDDQLAMHWEAARHTNTAYDAAFGLIAQRARGGGEVLESAVQARILEHFREHGLVTAHPPIVAVGPHSGDPHYETTPATDAPIRVGDFVLIDLWAKLDKPRSVYSDLTRVGFVGDKIPPRYEEVFQIVAAARDASLKCVREGLAADGNDKPPLAGWQVDQAGRDVIDRAGYGQYFVHRTGHSIGQETHGNGANMDNLETHEERHIIPRTCFSIEPGIYLPEFGVRSEINVVVDANGRPHISGGTPQRSVLPILLGS